MNPNGSRKCYCIIIDLFHCNSALNYRTRQKPVSLYFPTHICFVSSPKVKNIALIPVSLFDIPFQQQFNYL